MKIEPIRQVDLPHWPVPYRTKFGIRVEGRVGTLGLHRAATWVLRGVLIFPLLLVVISFFRVGPIREAVYEHQLWFAFKEESGRDGWDKMTDDEQATRLVERAHLYTLGVFGRWLLTACLVPAFLLKPLQYVNLHILTPFILKRRVSLEFGANGITFHFGKNRGRQFPFGEVSNGISFRVTNHPKAGWRDGDNSRFNAYSGVGRVQMLYGHRAILIEDMAWMDKAEDFVSVCLWAMKQVAPGIVETSKLTEASDGQKPDYSS